MFKETNGVHNADRSSLRATWQNGPYKTNTWNSIKHEEQQFETDNHNELCFVLKFCWYFPIFNSFLKMISPRNVELPSSYGQWLSFKADLIYSKPHANLKPHIQKRVNIYTTVWFKLKRVEYQKGFIISVATTYNEI